MKKHLSFSKEIVFLLFLGSIALPSFAQVQQGAPPIKTAHTILHKAVQKDTAWVMGPVVDRIYFVKFDNQGRKWVENSLNPDGSADRKIVYVYGEDGRVKEQIIASVKKGGVTGFYQYQYDEQGRLNQGAFLDTNRKALLTVNVEFDESGKRVKLLAESENPVRRRSKEFIYDEDGKPVNVLEEDSQNPQWGKRTRAWGKSDSVPLKLYSDKVSLQPKMSKQGKVDYTYDVYNNWVKRVEYDGGKPEYIIVRTIVYADQSTDWVDFRLKGEVKKVTQMSYVAIPKGPETIDRGKKQGAFFCYEFDQQGRKTGAETYSDVGVLQGAIVYAYDETGNVKKEVYKSPLGEIKHSIVSNYSPKGELRSKTLFDSEDKTLRKGVFRYDVEGNCINETWFGMDGSKYSEFRYTYDPYGHQIEKQVLLQPEKSPDYEPVERSWSFKGQLLEEWIGNSPELRHRTYKYSTKGEVIGGTEQLESRPAQPYIYKFYNDDRGNWTKRIKFVDDIPVVYEERELVYFTKQ